MQKDILFDNIYIGHSVSDAEKFKSETFDVKLPVEKQEEESSKPPPSKDKPKSPLDLKFLDDPLLYVREKLDLFWTLAKRDPVEAMRFVPEVPIAAGVVLATAIAALFGVLFGGGAVPSKAETQDAIRKAQAKASQAKDKAAEAVSTGADKAQDGTQRRTAKANGDE